MNLKSQILVLIFIGFWLSTFLLINLGFDISMPFSIPSIIGVVFILIGLFKQVIKFKIEDFSYFIIGIMLISISIKLFYVYFNLFISCILIFISIKYYIKYNIVINESIKKLLRFVIILNLFLSFTSDTFILKKINQVYKYKNWTSKISWEDFEGKQIDSSIYSAQVYTGIHYKINQVYNYPRAIAISYMDKTDSWKKKSIDEKNKFLLNHEQLHFDIAELQVRQAKDSIRKIWLNNNVDFDELFKLFSNNHETHTNNYDKYTKHGTNISNQKVFDSVVRSNLKLYE